MVAHLHNLRGPDIFKHGGVGILVPNAPSSRTEICPRTALQTECPVDAPVDGWATGASTGLLSSDHSVHVCVRKILFVYYRSSYDDPTKQ